VRLFCQDESRIGLKLPTPRRLTGFGVKPRQITGPLYEYYWLYAAVEPKTGRPFGWRCRGSTVSASGRTCGNWGRPILRVSTLESLNVVILDNASAHIASALVMPENIALLYLPPYSAELNPVERLWQDLKARIDVFDARVRSSLAGLRDHVAKIICAYTSYRVAALTGYTYLIDAVNALQFERIGRAHDLDQFIGGVSRALRLQRPWADPLPCNLPACAAL
jgi:hypothetical protein